MQTEQDYWSKTIPEPVTLDQELKQQKIKPPFLRNQANI